MADGERGLTVRGLTVRGLTVRGLTARAGSFELAPADLDVPPGRVLALLGPSGSGKTTLLGVIAGLLPARGGTVRLDGADLTALPPERRGIGVVFQHAALFPHLSVAENVRFGPRARGERGDVAGLLGSLGLEHLASRPARTLSGGEAQRVALARALAIRPALLLLDEPLSALDLPAREELRGRLRDMLAGLAIPAIYVTHDRDEALTLGDDIAVLAAGALRQAGPAWHVAAAPADPVVARLLGWRDLGRGTAGQGVIALGRLTLRVPAGVPDGPADVLYRPEEVTVRPAGGTADRGTARFTARVERVTPAMPLAQVTLAGPPEVTALLLRRHLARSGLRPGDLAEVDLGEVRVLPATGPAR